MNVQKKRAVFSINVWLLLVIFLITANYANAETASDILSYRGDADTSIWHYQLRQNDTWQGDLTGTDITGIIYNVRLVTSPNSSSGQAITCFGDSQQDVNCFVWNETDAAWGQQIEPTDFAGINFPFDVTYESHSYDGLVCYRNTNFDASILRCRKYENGNWTAAFSGNEVTESIEYVRLYPDQNSNYIAVATKDLGDDIDIHMWNGTAFATVQSLSTNANTCDRCHLTAGHWLADGDFLFAHYNTSGNVVATRFDKSSGWSNGVTVMSGLNTGSFVSIDLVAAANGSTAILTAVDQDGDVYSSYYNSTDWSTQNIFTTNVLAGSETKNIALGWEQADDNEVIAVTVNSTQNYYWLWNGSQFTNPTALPTKAEASDWIQLTEDPRSGKMMLVVLGITNDLYTYEWNGSAFESNWTLISELADDQYWNAWFAYDYEDELSTWYSNVWDYRKEITINSSQVYGNHIDFPLLIRINNSADLVYAMENGSDFVFTDENNIQLNHEIELFNRTSGELLAWVKIPYITEDEDTTLFIYYSNNSPIEDQENPQGVWNEGYNGVWHLSEDPSGTAPQHQDSTISYINLTSAGSMTASNLVSGIIDGSVEFDGVNDRLTLTDTSIIEPPANMTISYWINLNELPSEQGVDMNVIYKTNSIAPWFSYQFPIGGTDRPYFQWINNSEDTISTYASTEITKNTWHYITFTKNGTTGTIYLNDTNITASGNDPITGTIFDSNGQFSISFGSNGKTVNGTVDEVRISSIAHSENWIKTEYNNQRFDSTMINIGERECINNSACVSILSPQNTTYENSSIDINYNVSNEDQCRIEFNGVNMSYPLCSNTTLTYVHFNDSSKMFAVDFAEGTGTTVYDRSTGRHTITYNGNPQWNTTGKEGTAMTFDGTGDYLNTSGISAGLGNNITVMAWVYSGSSTGSYRTVVSEAYAGDGNVEFKLGLGDSSSTTRMSAGFYDGTWREIRDDQNIQTNTWVHYTATYDGHYIRLYRDGELVSISSDQNRALPTGTNGWYIGKRHDTSSGNHHWIGALDEIIILNRTLSGTQIIQYYNEEAFEGAHNLKIWTNNSEGSWSGDAVNFSIYQENTAPNITTPTTTPQPAVNYDNLNCYATAADSESSNLYVEYKWYNQTSGVFTEVLGGVTYNVVNNTNSLVTTLPKASNKPGVWNCSVRSFDGNDYSEWRSYGFNVTSITVQNTTNITTNEAYFIPGQTGNATRLGASDNNRHSFYMKYQGGYLAYNITLNNTFKVGTSWNISRMNLVIEGYQENSNIHNLEIYNQQTSAWDLLDDNFMTVTETVHDYDLSNNFSQYVTANGNILIRFIHNSSTNTQSNSYEVVIDKIAVRLGSTSSNTLQNGTGTYFYDKSYIDGVIEKWYIPAEFTTYTSTLASDSTRHHFYMKYQGGYLIYNLTINNTFKTANQYNISKAQLIIEGYQEAENLHNLEIYNWTNNKWNILDNNIPTSERFLVYNLTEEFSDYVNGQGTVLIRYNHTSATNPNHNGREVIVNQLYLRIQKDGNAAPINNTPGLYEYDYSYVDGVVEKWMIGGETSNFTYTKTSDTNRHFFYMRYQGGYLIYNLTINNTFKTANQYNISKAQLIIEGYQENENLHNLEIYNWTNNKWNILDNSPPTSETLRIYNSIGDGFSDYVNSQGTILIRYNHTSSLNANNNGREVVINTILLRMQKNYEASNKVSNLGFYLYNYSYVSSQIENLYTVVAAGNFSSTRKTDNSYHQFYMLHQKGHIIYNITLDNRFRTGNSWNITSMELTIEGLEESAIVHNIEIYNFTSSKWQTLDIGLSLSSETLHRYRFGDNFTHFVNTNGSMFIRFIHNITANENDNGREIFLDYIILRTFRNNQSVEKAATPGIYNYENKNVTRTESEVNIVVTAGNYTKANKTDNSYHTFYMTAQYGYLAYQLNLSNKYRIGNTWNISSVELIFEGYQTNENVHSLQILNQNTSTWETINGTVSTTEDQKYYNLLNNFTDFFNLNGTAHIRFMHFSASNPNQATRSVTVDDIKLRTTQQGDAALVGAYNANATIIVNEPPNQSLLVDPTFNITYNVNDYDSGIASCSIYWNGTLNQTSSSISETVDNYFQITASNGNHYFHIECTDTSPIPFTYISDTYNLSGDFSPIINLTTIVPTPYYNATVVIQTNVTDEDVIWVNFTVIAPNGTIILNNVSGSQSGTLWDSNQVTLNAIGRWNYSIVAKDSTGLYGYESGQIKFLDISSLINPSTVNVNELFEISGKINFSNGSAGANSAVFIYINETKYSGLSVLYPEWSYRKSINISERNGTDFVNMQVKALMDTATPISQGKMNSDCSDVRVTDSSDFPISYWIDNCNATFSTIWLKVNLTANTNNTFNFYYGNPTAESESNITSVFEFADDFDDDSINTIKWQDTTGFREENGYLYGNLTTYRIRSLQNFSGRYVLETRSYTTTEANNGHQGGGWWGTTSNGFNLLYHPTNVYYVRTDSTWNGIYSFTYVGEWMKLMMNATGTSSLSKILRESDNGSDFRSHSNSGLSQEWVSLGKRNDDGNTGQSYNSQWDWIFVRKYATFDPSHVSTGVEEEGIITNSSGHYLADLNAPSLEGNYIITINSTNGDEYGLSLEYLTVEGTPTVIIYSPENTTYTTTSIDLNFSAYDTDGIDSCWYSLNNGVNTSISSCQNTTITANYGNNNITVFTNDTTGAIGYDSINFSVPIPPNTTIINPQNIFYANSNINISYNTSNVESCYIQLDDVNFSYPLCSNTSLTYVHFADSSKVFAVDFAEGVGSVTYDRSTGLASSAQTATWNTSGRYGTALTFDGSSDYVNFGTQPEWEFNNSNITISAWIYLSANTAWASIVGKSNDLTSSYALALDSSTGTKLHLMLNGTASNGWNKATSIRTLPLNRWTHIVSTWNGTHTIFYINSKAETPIALYATNFGTSTTELEIGRDIPGGDEYFRGSIDEVAIWNRTLSAKEIEYMYQNAALPGTHTLKIHANNSANDWATDEVDFTINGYSCNPQSGLDWNLNLNNSCNITNTQVAVATWNISSSGNGEVILENVNITYQQKIISSATGRARLIRNELVNIIGDNS